MNFDSAYSSDLGRQRNTAKLILAENLNDAPDLVELDGFKEWNYGGFEGKSNAEMWEPIFKENGLELDEEWSNYEKLVASLGDKGIADAIARLDQLNVAESYDEIVERGEKAMNQVVSDAKKNNNENILIVSSGSMIPTLLTTMTPEDYNGEKIGNCSVTKVIYSGDKYSVESIGDTSYLE